MCPTQLLPTLPLNRGYFDFSLTYDFTLNSSSMRKHLITGSLRNNWFGFRSNLDASIVAGKHRDSRGNKTVSQGTGDQVYNVQSGSHGFESSSSLKFFQRKQSNFFIRFHTEIGRRSFQFISCSSHRLTCISLT